jgi:dihydrofolate reductase
VTAVKESDGGDLHLIGRAAQARTLVAHDLIDEFQLMVGPVLLGGGKGLLDDGALRSFALTGSWATSTGALLLSYCRN